MSQNPERPPYRMAIVDRASTPGFPFECVFKCDSYADARAVCDFVIRGRPADEPAASHQDVLDVLRLVDNLLEQNRYTPDSSTRHNLAVAMSMLRPAAPPNVDRLEERITTALCHLELEVPDVPQAIKVLHTASTKSEGCG
jgi:hypothetical protein